MFADEILRRQQNGALASGLLKARGQRSYRVVDAAAMLALPARPGDQAELDDGSYYQLLGADPSQLESWYLVAGESGGGASAEGVGDVLRVYSSTGTQALPVNTNTKVALFDSIVNPANGWSYEDYGHMDGGSTFEWDAANDRVRVLRACIVQPFLNVDVNFVDVRLVDPATGKVDPAAPLISYIIRPVSAAVFRNDAVVLPATRAVGAAYGSGGGNTPMSAFPVPAGDYVEFYLRATGASMTLAYVDMSLTNIANLPVGWTT